ncbi:Wzz/FepE/Etk N-terminal domain-containing protein [Foetidibacter luteolus]|uniref:Wzz/FepE/Etk N-terminal domain-containing protein n=1 Tax=Foetidibacter luteolus TaxID=2608880 RepID=UPI00129B7B67|nr:Wzz/FepE/Etk N-terminal domain-containing protein [Foetidibacter luteolus]
MPELKQDEISLKDIIAQLVEWTRYLLSKWVTIIVVAIITAGLGLLYAYKSKPTYAASINFVLSNSSSSYKGVLGLASQFGIDLSGGSDDVFAGNNIISLMKSRRMIQKALLRKPDGQTKTLVNIYVEDFKLDKDWKELPRLANAYPFPEIASKMSMVQDSLFRDIYFKVAENMLDVSRPDNKLSVYKVVTTSKNETFSYYFTRYLVDETSQFYIDTKTSNAKRNLSLIQHEADSIRVLLGGTIASAAAETDKTFNLNPAYQVRRSGVAEGQLHTQALGLAYGEVIKNLELAKITLQKETPLYQIIDEPTLPLLVKKPGKLLSLIAGGFLGGFLICGFLIIRKILSNLDIKEAK